MPSSIFTSCCTSRIGVSLLTSRTATFLWSRRSPRAHDLAVCQPTGFYASQALFRLFLLPLSSFSFRHIHRLDRVERGWDLAWSLAISTTIKYRLPQNHNSTTLPKSNQLRIETNQRQTTCIFLDRSRSTQLKRGAEVGNKNSVPGRKKRRVTGRMRGSVYVPDPFA